MAGGIRTDMQELEKILEEIELEKKRVSLSPDCSNEHAVIEIILLEKIEKIIRKHMNDGWIPVEKELPEEKQSVLVQWEKYDKHLNVTLTYLDVMWLDDAEEGIFETINGVPNGKVIALQPLPEPYRPEGTITMTENEAIAAIRWRIDTASKSIGKGIDGKAYEDMEMAIKALEEVQEYREIGTVEECREAVEKQKPKKTIPVTSGKFYDLGFRDKCPNCGSAIKVDNIYHYDVCKICGQKVINKESEEE